MIIRALRSRARNGIRLLILEFRKIRVEHELVILIRGEGSVEETWPAIIIPEEIFPVKMK
jgi:hypothetical protein